MNSHLTPQQMLAYIDGELSKPETRQAKEHLHSCWTCLTGVESLKDDIATILDAHNECFVPSLSRPPQPWPGYKTLLTRTLPAQPASLWMRFGTLLTPVRILVVSGIVAVLSVCVYSIFGTKPVSAKEVLRRVQVADTQRSTIMKDQVIREQIHVRETRHALNHPKLANVDVWKSPAADYWNVSEGDSAATDLKAQYKAHAIPLGLPLSAAAVDAWGKATGDSPTASRQGSDVDLSFAGSNDGTAGSVERVSFIVQAETWQIKRMTLDFSDVSFEVTEDSYSVMQTNAVPADLLAHLEPEALPLLVTKPVVQPVYRITANSIHLPAVNLDKAELAVFIALHGLKADLGEPITVTRTKHDVQVGIWQLPDDRQNQLRDALAGQPDVQVELTAPSVPAKDTMEAQTSTPLPPFASNTPLHINVESDGDGQRLLKYFGTSDKEQDFTNEALANSTALLSHLYALRNLQLRFSAMKSQSLASEEQAQLRTLVEDHASSISTNLDALSTQFAPVEANFDVAPCASPVSPTATDWQSGSLGALVTAKRIDYLLRALLTTDQSPATPDSALPQIDWNLCLLRVEVKNLNTLPH